MALHLDRLDSQTQAIVNAAFPSYNGRKFKIEVASHPLNVKSYWDGGSRDYFTFVNLQTRETLTMPPQSAYDAQIAGADKVNLPVGFVCVEHSIFCGKDSGITIHVHPDNAPMLLPAPSTELTDDQKTVLKYTRAVKSSYAGIKDYRYYSHVQDVEMEARVQKNGKLPMTRDAWDAAKSSLISSGHLNKAGAITADGRNAIADIRY